MLFNEIVTLIIETHTINDIGDIIPVQAKRQVFADKQSVRQSEFYQSAATGLKPELMFVVRSIDYQDEPKIEYNGKQYTVTRAYAKGAELTELICQGVVNNG